MTPAGGIAAPAIEVRRADQRFRTRTASIDTWHSFSFGAHHDEANTGHGLLLAHNEERLDAGAGFDWHRHREVEIVSWVLSGSLRHEDDTGHRSVVGPGTVQRLSAGTGVEHAERADDAAPVHFVQMWVVSDDPGRGPSYAQREIPETSLAGSLLPIASGRAEHGGTMAIPIRNRQAALLAGRLAPDDTVELPDAPYVHVYLAQGAVTVDRAGPLAPGDALRLRAAGELRVTASEPAELLVWQMFGPAAD